MSNLSKDLLVFTFLYVNNMCNVMKVADKEDGNVSCDGKKITINNYMKSLKDSASGNFKSDKISKEDILKYSRKERYTCE